MPRPPRVRLRWWHSSIIAHIDHIWHRQGRVRGAVRIAVAGAAALIGLSAAVPVQAARAAEHHRQAELYPAKNVTFDGHGWGPAWGLAQWGAFGYAASYHKSFTWLLDHYYPGTSLEQLTKKKDRRIIRVSIEENANAPVVVTSQSSFTVTSAALKTPIAVAAGKAVKSVLVVKGSSAGTWKVFEASACTARSCSSPCSIATKSWHLVASALTDPVALPASSSASAPASDLLQLCRADGQDVTYRGSLEAYDYYGSQTGNEHLSRTLSLIPLEQYVADVTPAESPAGWGRLPSGTSDPVQHQPYGFQELEAQAIAARTYVLAEIAAGGWYGYADICDDVCQSYMEGAKWENSVTNLAVSDTVGQFLTMGSPPAPAPTQYASSSGGYTQGSPAFPPVIDKGDAVCLKKSGGLGCNPWHDWTASVPVSAVESTFPTIGKLSNVKVTQCNGYGDWGGRVVTIEVIGTNGSATASGNQWMFDFGFLSNWFAVTNGPAAKAKGACGVNSPSSSRPRLGGGTGGAGLVGTPGHQAAVPPPGRVPGLAPSAA